MKKAKQASTVIIMMVLLIGLACNASAQTSETYTWKNVVINGGGYVPGIIFSPAQQNLIYARTDMGGAYRWNQSTKSWTQLLAGISHDNWNWTGCESIAPDPVDANKVYLAVGTYTNDWAPTNGAILRSSDQGATYSITTLSFKLGSNMPGRNMGERLVIDPNKTSILYLGARSGNGLWKSTDSGVTWAKVSSFPDAGTYVQDASNAYLADKPGVCWITFDPATGSSGNATQTIYVGVASLGNSIYRSTDGGSTWAAVAGQPTGYLPHHGVLGSNGILYVTYSDTQGPYDGAKGDVYKYATATGAWTMISPVPSSSADDYYGYGGLAVDKQSPDTLMVTSLNSWWPDAIIFRSTDAGATWKRIWEWASYPARTLHYTMDVSTSPWLDFGNHAPVDPEPAVKIGWMIGDIKIDPYNSARMFYGTGATVFGSENLTNWDSAGTFTLKSFAVGIEETAVTGLISPPSGVSLISTLGDIGGFVHTSLTSVMQDMHLLPYAGSYHGIDYAELTPTYIIRVGCGDSAATYPKNLSSAFSFDGGTTWSVGNGTISGITSGGTVAAAADASAVVWSPEGAVPSYSTDNGNSWVTCNGISTGAFVCSDRVNPNKFYAVQSGTVYVSTDKGKTFTVKASGFTAAAKIKAVPGLEGNIWLTAYETSNNVPVADAGLYRSTDSGTTFTKVLSGTITFAEAVGFGKAATGQTHMAVYMYGTVNGTKGVFRSDDAGAAWILINDAQHQYGWIGKCITGDPRIYGRVYCATNGFGIVYGDTTGSTATAIPTTPTTATADPTAAPNDTIGPTDVPTATPAPTDTPAPTAIPTATPAGVTVEPTAPPTTVTLEPTTPPTTATDPPPVGCTCTNLCSSQTSITVPFTKDGAGEFCYVSTALGSYVNSWNTDAVNVNGTSCTNTYVSSSSIAAIGGYYYIYLKASYSWSHLEIK